MKELNMIEFKSKLSTFIRYTVLFIPLLLLSFSTGDNKSQYTIPVGAHTVCCSDIESDGDIDIITGHSVNWGDTNKSISVLDNIDHGIFVVKDTSKSFYGYQENIFTIRVNPDSLFDLVVFHIELTNETQQNYIRVYYNDQGNFNIFSDFSLENDAAFNYINHGKVNSDEYDDIVVIANNAQFWGILYNDGNGGFTPPQYFDLDYPPTDITCGDLNGDSLDDVLVAGFILVIYYSNDNGFIYDSTGLHQRIVKITDIDNDDDFDIVGLSGLFSTNIITFFENIGDSNFFTHEPIYYSPYCDHLIVADLNNDSLPDLITTSVNNGIYLLYNEGNYELSDPVFISVPLVGYDVLNTCSADFDNNGFNDLVITHGSAQYLNLLFNDGYGNFVENPITTIENIEIKKQILVCYPNPFDEETSFEFTIKESETVELNIYGLQGSLIKSLTKLEQKGGQYYKIKWDGFDAVGKPCNPGPLVAYLKVNGKVSHAVKLIKLN